MITEPTIYSTERRIIREFRFADQPEYSPYGVERSIWKRMLDKMRREIAALPTPTNEMTRSIEEFLSGYYIIDSYPDDVRDYELASAIESAYGAFIEPGPYHHLTEGGEWQNQRNLERIRRLEARLV